MMTSISSARARTVVKVNPQVSADGHPETVQEGCYGQRGNENRNKCGNNLHLTLRSKRRQEEEE